MQEIRKLCAGIGGNFADAKDPQLLGEAVVYFATEKVEAILDAGVGGTESKWCLKLKITVVDNRITGVKVKCADSNLDILCQFKLLTGTPLFLDEAESVQSERESGGRK